MAQHNQLGKKGEELGLAFLRKEGYEIIAQNWRYRKFEIDIIAQNNNELVFIEVKTRSSILYGAPEEAVTPQKQAHLIAGAACYIELFEIDVESRFDVISIVLNSNQQEIKHIKYAFYPEA